MEIADFLLTCKAMQHFHIPRYAELPEFDLYMDQVIALAEKYLSPLSPDGKGPLTPSMINNYVKSGVLPPPVNKKYNRTHLSILTVVCIMKPVMEISAVSDIIHRNAETVGIEHMLDRFAEIFEAELSKAAAKAEEICKSADLPEVMGVIAIEKALKANANRTVAMHAYRTIEKEKENTEKPEKSEKGK